MRAIYLGVDSVFVCANVEETETSQPEIHDSPMPVTVAVAVRTSPVFPPGLTKEVPISTETPVIYCPFVATAKEPNVSVRDMIRPPCTVYCDRASETRRERTRDFSPLHDSLDVQVSLADESGTSCESSEQLYGSILSEASRYPGFAAKILS